MMSNEYKTPYKLRPRGIALKSLNLNKWEQTKEALPAGKKNGQMQWELYLHVGCVNMLQW